MFKKFVLVFVLLAILIVCVGCSNIDVKLNCTKSECKTTITNLEKTTINTNFTLGYEAQGTNIANIYRFQGTPAQAIDHRERNIATIFSQKIVLGSLESVTVSSTLPAEVQPGQMLIDAKVSTDPGYWGTDVDTYHALQVLDIPGEYTTPVEYSLSCNGGVLTTTINYDGLWGARYFSIYLNDDISTAWQSIPLVKGTITTSVNLPDNINIVEIDVDGHEDSSNQFHNYRQYCIPQ